MNQDLSILHLVANASAVVQVVMAGLLLTSLASWTVIFAKLIALSRVKRANEAFEREFWSGRSLAELHQAAASRADSAPLERIFASGMREFLKLREKRLDAATQLDGARRAMRASFQRELDVIESNLSFLASVGSVSPYVGLFGTVWGIMHAFTTFGSLQQVTLSSVAPAIAEALIATAIGLFAAIPAVVAYNRLARDIDRIAIQLETFIEEFTNILQRNVGAGQSSATTQIHTTVAPAIAEALIATAIGLFAAIPAVVAYNRLARDIDRIAIQLETFIEEFTNILQRNVGAGQASATTQMHTTVAPGAR